jgi:hypothetical protein
MKRKKYLYIVPLLVAFFLPAISKAQSIADDLEQLSLDYQKLAGLKSILKQMYQGYEIISKGYNAVKNVSQGNFSLNEAFLDGLYLASPTVRSYPRAADIVGDQLSLMREYQSAYSTFRQDKHFSPDEVGYMLEVYNNLVNQSLKNLSDLSMILTDSQLRMSDAERIKGIDRIYVQSHGQLNFLRQFNNQTYQVAVRRANDEGDRQTLKNLYGIK